MGIFRLTWSDPYGKDDGEAGYVHTMAIRSEMHGQNLGEAILKMVGSEVRQEGKQSCALFIWQAMIDCAFITKNEDSFIGVKSPIGIMKEPYMRNLPRQKGYQRMLS